MEDTCCDMIITSDAAYEFERVRTIVRSVTGKTLNNSELIILLCNRLTEKMKISK